ncbi:MAG: Ig-like domain-containing protein [Myxococcota bacterium]
MQRSQQAHRLALRHWRLILALPILGLTSCSGGDDDDASPSPSPTTVPEMSCVADPLSQQPRSRFLTGSTFYLPTLQETCSSQRWSLTLAPENNRNELVQGADGIARFSPSVPGAYRFTLGDTGEEVSLSVIEASDAPFHNLNLYGTRTMTAVNGEIWVANVFTPSITRVDAQSLKVTGKITVGAWPVALAYAASQGWVVVAQRGSDTLGLVDVASGRLVDAIWVGDEPSNVVLSPDGSRAYVTLATEGVVAVVELASRSVIQRYALGIDLLGLTLSADGKTLYAATHRSGQVNQYPFPDFDPAQEKDVFKLDLASGEVTPFLDVGSTLSSLVLNQDGKLLVTNTINNTDVSLTDAEGKSFTHEVTVLDPMTGARVGGADLSRQESSTGAVVSLHTLAESTSRLWVPAEGNDVTLGLNRQTLAEEVRVATPGRPRHVLAVGETLFTHGQQGFVLTRFSSDGSVTGSVDLEDDPRTPEQAAGQRYFTGAGRSYAETWSCNSCHLDGRGDTVVWNAGPNDAHMASRSFFWLEGTKPLGWSAYVDSVRNFAFTVNTNVGVRPTTTEADALYAYLASMMPPPAANGWTTRDGGLSEQALRGKALYEGKADCSACHALPLTTSRGLLEQGISEGLTDIPSLVGSYRHNVWLKDGSETTLRGGVRRAAEWLGKSLSDAELDDLTRYVSELTARDFFLLVSEPQSGNQTVAVDQSLALTFSYPVFNNSSNLARITLKDSSGATVAALVTANNRHVTVTPDKDLKFASSYTLEIAAGVESFDEKKTATLEKISFKTGAEPELSLDGDYVWTVQAPSLNFSEGTWDYENPTVTVVNLKAKASAGGADIDMDYFDGLAYPTYYVVSGTELVSPALPIPIGPSFSDSTGMQGTLEDEDGDGVADRASGLLTMSGPGFVLPDVSWTLTRPLAEDVCEEGQTGKPVITLTAGEAGKPVISWEGSNAISLYVTDPSAVLPAGPTSTVKNGETYWGVEVIDFDLGFVSPVTYSVLPENATDATDRHSNTYTTAAPLEAGRCYKFSVINKNFSTGTLVVRWQE